ncbi:MAG: twin-arginine translocase TatA/TatE family subunit [Pedobacter sp.]
MQTGVILEFLNMGGGEIMLILGVVMLLFGGKKLPELARGLGKGIRDFKDASEGVKREIHRNINAMDIDEDLKAENDKYDQQYPKPTLEEQMYPTAAAAAPINLTKTSDTEEVEIPASESPSEVAAEAPVSASGTTVVPASPEATEVPVAKPATAPLGTPIAAYSATAAAEKAATPASSAAPEVSATTETATNTNTIETVTPDSESTVPSETEKNKI